MRNLLHRLRLCILRLLGGVPAPEPVELHVQVDYLDVLDLDQLTAKLYIKEKVAGKIMDALLRGHFLEEAVSDRPANASIIYQCRLYPVKPGEARGKTA